MAPKKFYQLVGRNEKPVSFQNSCLNLSWFVIITFSFYSLFLACENSSFFTQNRTSPTLNITTNEQFTAEVLENDSAVKPPAEVSENNSAVKRSFKQPAEVSENDSAVKPDECAEKYIYVLDLPSEFNSDFLENCSTINPWINVCTFLSNSGLGPWLNVTDKAVFSGSNWFATDQWSLEVIFHKRMNQYKCLTNDYSKASAVFVPFYAGLDVGRYLWTPNPTLRDETSIKLIELIKQKPTWERFGGRDHFLIAGRMTWDFSRVSENTSAVNGWGNRLLRIPEVNKMTTLLLESNETSKSEIAIPYPTYFHPSSGNEVEDWQKEMRQKNRSHLFSFAGAPRPAQKESIRNILIEQCLAANGNNCKYLHTNPDVKPEDVMKVFQSADFCLQPPGDSLTRKSVFDTIIAGCIPVLFHPGSAYTQYVWHMPEDYSSYSVFIPMDELRQGNVSIEKRLLGISREKVFAMREEVIKMIPKIVYANPNAEVDGLEDAFDVAVKGVLNRVNELKMELKREENVRDKLG